MQPPTISDQQLAQAALAFIERAQISAQEAESMVIVKNWLRGLAAPPASGGGDGERVTPLRPVGVAGESNPKEAA